MKSFDTSPKPAFLLAMQNQKWSVAGALGELIDNSFGPARGNAGMVTITFNHAKRTLEVLDNGRGVDQLHRVVQLGNTIGRGIGDIGLYGRLTRTGELQPPPIRRPNCSRPDTARSFA